MSIEATPGPGVATTARLNVNPASPYAKFNGQIFPITYHLANAVALAMPYGNGTQTVDTDFNLSEVELLGERPAHLVQKPTTADDYPTAFEWKESFWEGTHTSYIWQKNGPALIVGETAAYYLVRFSSGYVGMPLREARRVKKTGIRFPVSVAAAAAEAPAETPVEAPAAQEPAAAPRALPAGPYTVTSTMFGAGGSFERFADACGHLAGLRHNQPHATHSLFDAHGYLVPSTDILRGLAIVRRAAMQELAYIGTFEAVIAPAYETNSSMAAQDIAEQAIKAAREASDAPAFTCYTTTIGTATGPATVVRGEVGTTATVQPALLRFLRECKKQGARWDDSRDFSEPTPAGAMEVCLWLLWGTAIHLQRRIFITHPVGEGPADGPAPTAPTDEPARALGPPRLLSDGLEPWQRQALIDAAGGEPADLLARCTDEQLVLAAGFMPMLPALLLPEQRHMLPETPASAPRARDARPSVLPAWHND
jgi:hypothetical protein